ncbi:MAG TPA: hypothetical protein VNS22_16245 [Geminicoccus sp.]|uniref:hypothetical protein n=1 Tax=Geminicoccus sp. TaxID=2024832 RepID=UPI002CDC37F9|nr:hypothetical protein [Geminicoccus sp.]HWL69922.1 hypothetical protein [Geminicoccus sp.]
MMPTWAGTPAGSAGLLQHVLAHRLGRKAVVRAGDMNEMRIRPVHHRQDRASPSAPASLE